MGLGKTRMRSDGRWRRGWLTLPMLNAANKGVSYLRIRSTAEATDMAGMLIENVSMDLTR